MKINGRIIIYILTVVMIIIAAAGYFTKDRTAPEIIFGENVPVYNGDADDPELLSNVKAYDNKDGDVTASLYVDSVMFTDDNKNAVVTYVAMDSVKNVKRLSQTLNCSPAIVKAEEKKERN